MRGSFPLLAAGAMVILIVGCAEPAATPPEGPYVLALGTAQDGGLPHAGCSCERCLAALANPERRRLVASLAIVLPDSGRTFLIDVSPDIREQLQLLSGADDEAPIGVDRSPVDGVFLTHAHIGHYLGLAFFGFEAIHTRALPVYATAAMVEFINDNGPWDQLVRLGNIDPIAIEPGTEIDLGDGVTMTALAVPHRREYTDTVGFVIGGPRTRVLYVPDTDGWSSWEPPLTELLGQIDIALLDGTFFSTEELPGRDTDAIGHPLIVDSLELLEPIVSARAAEVRFTHLNHSNPALDPAGAALAEIESRGFRVLSDGERIPL